MAARSSVGLRSSRDSVVRVQWADAAAHLRELLGPFSGCMPICSGIGPDVPVDHHLAALALLVGDVDEAVHRARSALDLARRMRSPVLEAHALDLLAEATGRTGDARAAASARDAVVAIAEPIGVRLDRCGVAGRLRPLTPAPVVPVGARSVSVRLDAAAGSWNRRMAPATFPTPSACASSSGS